MKLRYVLLMAATGGAFSSLLLAFNLYAHMRETERGAESLSRADLVRFETVHALGLLTLSFLFLALFLLLLAALRDPKFIARIENEPAQAQPEVKIVETPVTAPAIQPNDLETSPTAEVQPPLEQQTHEPLKENPSSEPASVPPA